MEGITLNYIRDILESYADSLRQYDSVDKKELWLQKVAQARSTFLECLRMMSNIYPELLQVNMPAFMDEEDLKRLGERLRANSSRRFSLDYLATACHFTDVVNGETIETPTFVPWQDENNTEQNFVINYTNSQKREAKTALCTLVLNMMLSLPANKVLLNVFDFNMTGMADELTTRLEPGLFHDEIIFNYETAGERIRRLLEHMAMVMKKYGNLVAYNNRNREIALPYEIIILNCYPYNFDSYIKELMPLFENGPKCGIYFIVLNNTDYSLRDREEQQLLDVDNYQTIELPDESDRDAIVRYTPFSTIPLIANECFNYLNEECTKKPKRQLVKQDFSSIVSSPYRPVMSEMSVTIGLDLETKEEVTVRFNSKDYLHSFILGQSGSGKSVLLNNIITSAINKYAPEDLMLYLMDFKGVEFNKYKGIKHAKAVLVDNSDPQLTLEILRELKEENRKRVKLWQAEGVTNIDGYNKKHPDDRMQQVLFVADECQVMFSKSDGSSLGYKMQREIADIINIIATQGRSQGIHMLLATQTLAETDISGQVLNNLTECFLLMSAPADSNLLVPDSSDLTEKQPVGECCYFHKKGLVSHVQTFFASDEELDEAIKQSQLKAQDNQSNGSAYFCGSAMYRLENDDCKIIAEASTKSPVAAVGHNVGLSAQLTAIKLQRDFGENILFFGVNKEEQTVGVMINALLSLIISCRQIPDNLFCDFKVIDCLNNEEACYRGVLETMRDRGLCQIIERSESGLLLQQLVNDICNQCATPTIVAIIGSERFAEMKRKSPLPSSIQTDDFDPENDIISMNMEFMDALMGDGNNLDASKIKTYPDALKFILDEGPMQGVHILLQVDKPENILFEGEYCSDATDKFNHKVILRSENKFILPLRFSEEIDVEALGEEEERLRAYYYPENGKPQLFTPYLMPKSNEIINKLIQ